MSPFKSWYPSYLSAHLQRIISSERCWSWRRQIVASIKPGMDDQTVRQTLFQTPLFALLSPHPACFFFQPLVHFYLFLHINWRLYNFALVSTSNFPPLPVSCLWVIALNSEHCSTKNFSSLNFKRKSFEGLYDFRAKMLHLKQKKITSNCFVGDQHDYYLVLSSIKFYCVGNNGGAR